MPFQRHTFYSRMKESGESYDHYQTALRQFIAERCEFESISPNQFLRDKLVFRIRDSKVRERLLCEKNLSLEKTDEICSSHETMVQQMKVVGDAGLSVADAGNVNAVSKKPKRGKRRRGCVEEISAVTLDDSQLVTLKLESGNYLRFQSNTGDQCNVVPLHLYKKATKDVDLCNVTPVNMVIILYGGSSIPILGTGHLRVWRRDFRCLLDCNLVDSKKVRPILGRKACLGMNVIQYLDNDQLQR